MTDALEAARKPLVIDGSALGGGLEIALVCHGLSTPKAKLGLTELQFGLLPGLGGTQRLPRLVGLPKALEMILMSKLVKGDEAHTLGLVDAIASPDELINTARSWALNIAEHTKPRVASLYRTDKLWPLSEAKEILMLARKQAQEQCPNVAHPMVCIDVIEEGIVSGPRAGLWKVPGITDLGLVARKINKVAIVGGELMGPEIATVLILNNYLVFLKEENEKSLQVGIERVKANLQSLFNKRELTSEMVEKTLSLLQGVLHYDSLREVDLNTEAVSENISLKQQVFSDLENLPHAMPLLEVVRTRKTSPQVIVDLLDVVKKIKKIPSVVGSSAGFAVNRMFFYYSKAAMLLVECGADIYQVDRAITNFGFPMGPFRMIDLVGLGVATAIGNQFVKNFPDRAYTSMLLHIMQESNQAGESKSYGFSLYDNKRKASTDSELEKKIMMARSISGISLNTELVKLHGEELVEVILFPVVNEACRILAEGIAAKVSDLDIASVIGLGFPSYRGLRGGIIFWADCLGPKYICSKLEEWSKTFSEFFRPCAYLLERASKGTSLGATVAQVVPRL